MRNETRALFKAYLSQIASLNGVPDATEKFNVAPSVQQKLEQKVQETSDFLSKINNIGVTEQQGDKIGLGIGSPVASTTNTATTDRSPIDPTTLDERGYVCTKTDFDTFLTYQKLDTWAKFPNFQTLIRDALLKRQVGFDALKRKDVEWVLFQHDDHLYDPTNHYPRFDTEVLAPGRYLSLIHI